MKLFNISEKGTTLLLTCFAPIHFGSGVAGYLGGWHKKCTNRGSNYWNETKTSDDL